ncbi:MAG: PAS domain S-box protein [Chitinivibrionales bacterium]|nr:PAS domain S-box protein [Chitinivibrionales bacterium]MBD3358004.1 PAS domain S-box protein [Chitinivibrionales bacterium]
MKRKTCPYVGHPIKYLTKITIRSPHMQLAKRVNSLAQIVSVDEGRCVNCHACISACPVKYCNDGSGDYVKVNANMCIGCGACLSRCTHQARYYIDDFNRFYEDLSQGKDIVAIVAPSIAANFPDNYLRINGWLKSIGVDAIFDVGFGAELTVKSYIDYIDKHKDETVLAQPCPAIVTFIELYMPDLIPHLIKVDSPMLHAMKMIRQFYPDFAQHSIAVLSPCMAKKREFIETGYGDYNISFRSIQSFFEHNGIPLSDFPEIEFDSPPAESAVLFSSPGGLMRTANHHVPGIESTTRKIEGSTTIYEYLETLPEAIKAGIAPKLVDCLNCEFGCNVGPLTITKGKSVDEIEAYIEKRKAEKKQKYLLSCNNDESAAIRAVEDVVEKFWQPGLYNRAYRDLSINNHVVIPQQERLDEIYELMHKYTQRDLRNCNSCGYGSCENMAIAIHNGLNKPENCHFYLAEEAVRAHNEISDNEKRLRNILSTSAVGFCLADTDCRIILVNNSLCRLLNMTEEKLIGSSILAKQFLKCSNKKPYSTELKVNRSDGLQLSCLLTINPYVEDDELLGYFAMATDVSYLRQPSAPAMTRETA